jgi:hypothetical protein
LLLANLGKMCQGVVQLFHHGRACAFLRAENGRSAAQSAQGVVYINSQFKHNIVQAGVQPGSIDRCQVGQRGSARCQGLALLVKQLATQGLKNAYACIVGGTAAQTNDNFPGALIQRCHNKLTNPVRSGRQRITLRAGNLLQPCSFSHFNEGYVFGQQSPTGCDGFTVGVLYVFTYTPATGRGKNGIQRTFATIGHRYAPYLCLWYDIEYAARNSCCHPAGAKAFFERVGRYNNTHGSAAFDHITRLAAMKRFDVVDQLIGQ